VNFLRQIAYPLSVLYGIITSFRNFLYNKHIFKSTAFKTPVIVVGNLSIGGTGKTPQIEYLIRLLKNEYKIAVLSRGYKRKSKGFIIADKNTTAEIIGDEPYQYYKKFEDIIVAVDANRTNGIHLLEELENPPDIILLDDAFQHRKVKAGLNILLTSYNNLYVDDMLLPTGNLREKINGAKRAQIIIVTKCPSDISKKEQLNITEKLNPTSQQTIFFTTIEYNNKLKGFSTFNLDELKNVELLLITGIANPTPLIDYLGSKKIKFKHLKYPDHYHFKNKDIEVINEMFYAIQSNKKIILTTEKDYVRIFAELRNLVFIEIKTKFVNGSIDFDKTIKNYVE